MGGVGLGLGSPINLKQTETSVLACLSTYVMGYKRTDLYTSDIKSSNSVFFP